MKLRLIILTLLGVALGAYLIFYVGLGAVISAALRVGWGGFAVLCAFGLALFAWLALGWRVLVPGSSLRALLWGRAVRDSAAEVLPFSQFGGFILGARAAILEGVPAPVAAASMVADVTTEMMGEIAYIALGLSVLTARAPHNAFVASLIDSLAIGLALLTASGLVFLLLQHRSLWIMDKIVSRWLTESLAGANAVAAELDAIYRAPVRVLASFVMHFGGWIASSYGAWLAFRFVGAQIDFIAVLAMESVVYAVRSAAIVVPNALGVQEATYAVLAPLLGVPPELALAVSLLKRARDIAIGVPILVGWQAREGQHALSQARPNRNS